MRQRPQQTPTDTHYGYEKAGGRDNLTTGATLDLDGDQNA
jgi:hypothetical protein